jgi:hypothetical protein
MSIQQSDIIHRADLRIYDEIVEALKTDQPVSHLVKEFWDGIERPSPRIELTVRKATVVKKIADNRGAVSKR